MEVLIVNIRVIDKDLCFLFLSPRPSWEGKQKGKINLHYYYSLSRKQSLFSAASFSPPRPLQFIYMWWITYVLFNLPAMLFHCPEWEDSHSCKWNVSEQTHQRNKKLYPWACIFFSRCLMCVWVISLSW